MTTTTSFSNRRRRTFFFHSLRELLPLSILTAIVSILVVPIPFINELDYYQRHIGTLPPDHVSNYVEGLFYRGVMGEGRAVLLTFFISLLALTAALVTHRSLHQRTSTDFFFALPLDRTEMLTLHLGAATAATAIPCFAVQLVTVALQQFFFRRYGAFGLVYCRETLLDWITLLLAFSTVYLFVTAFAATQGTTFDSLAISMALGFSPVLIMASSLRLFQQNLYGISPARRFLPLCSPLTWPIYAFSKRSYRYAAAENLTPFYLLWLLLIALLFLLCRFLMERRRGELAGVSQQGFSANLVKGAAAFLGGILLHSLFSGDTFMGQLGYFFLGTLVAGVLAEIILSRGAHALLHNAKWPLLGGACLTLVFCTAYFDIFSLEQRIPAAENIKSVSVSYQGRFEDLHSRYYGRYTDEAILTSRDSIDTVLALHREIVANAPRYQEEWSAVQRYPLRLYYQEQNGKTTYRNYDQLRRSDFGPLSALESQEDFIRSSHILFQLEELGDAQTRTIQSVNLYDTLFDHRTTLRLDNTQVLQLLDALRADLLGETLEEILLPTQPSYGYMELTFREIQSVSELLEDSETGLSFVVSEDSSCLVLLTAEYRNTIALLQQWGYSQTFGQELEEITSATVFLVNSWGWNNRTDRVVVVTPTDTDYANEIKTHWNYSASVTDLKDLEAILNTSHNQLFLTDEMLLSGEILYILFEDNVGGIGVKLLPLQYLPEQYRSNLGIH